MTAPISVSSVRSVTGEHEAKTRPISLSPQHLSPSPEHLATELTELTEPEPVDLLTVATDCTASTADALALVARWARDADRPTYQQETQP